MKIALRTDASEHIGIGHVMRCLTLADILTARGGTCQFLCRVLPGPLEDTIINRGHAVTRLPTGPDAAPEPSLYGAWLGVSQVQDADNCISVFAQDPPDLLIVDHYALDATWENRVRPADTHLLVLDDLANRPHNCDLLLDQNLGRVPEDYNGYVPDHTVRLIGPDHALLRSEFAEARPAALEERDKRPIRNLLISMGGVDQNDATSAIIRVLADMQLPGDMTLTVVMGPAASNLDAVRSLSRTLPLQIEVLSNVTQMAPLMAASDIAIGGAGGTSWERCALGLPTFLLTIADNQMPAAQALQRTGAAVSIGDIRTTGWQCKLQSAMTRALQDTSWHSSLITAAARVCDGHGAARVRDVVTKISGMPGSDPPLSLRRMTIADARLVYGWRYTENAVQYYKSSDTPSFEDHIVWVEKHLRLGDKHLFIAERAGVPVAHVRLDPILPAEAEVSICVAPTHQGQGIGRLALEALPNHALGLGLKELHATVHRKNIASKHLFEKAGFTVFDSTTSFLELRASLNTQHDKQ